MSQKLQVIECFPNGKLKSLFKWEMFPIWEMLPKWEISFRLVEVNVYVFMSLLLTHNLLNLTPVQHAKGKFVFSNVRKMLFWCLVLVSYGVGCGLFCLTVHLDYFV